MNRTYLLFFFALFGVASAQVTVPWEDVTKPVALSSLGALTPVANRIPYYVDPTTAGLITVGGNLSLTAGTLNLSATPNIGAASGASLNVSGAVSSGGFVSATTATGVALTGSNSSMEIGAVGASNTPYIDLHSSASSTDYDVRLLVSGGTASIGQGNLTVTANTTAMTGNLSTAGSVTSGGTLSSSAAFPQVRWNVTGEPVDGRLWQALGVGNTWQLRALNDADNASSVALAVTRSPGALGVTNVQVGNNSSTVTIPGTVVVSGTAAANAFASQAMNIGSGAGAGDVELNLGSTRNANGNAFIDLVGDTTYTDYGLRLRRHNTGANANSSLDHRGTGTFSINAPDGGVIALNATTAIKGTTTNDSASAGYVGEYIAASVIQGNAVAMTSATALNVASITLTAGDWDVEGLAFFVGGSGVNVAQTVASVSIFSGTNGAVPTVMNNTLAGTLTASTPVTRTRISVSATTAVYLVSVGYFSGGTLHAYGHVSARRSR